MTYGEKLRILTQYRRIDQRINRLIEEKETWMERATAITPVYRIDSGSGSHSGDGKIPAAIEKIDEIEREITAEIDRLADLRRIIRSGIQRLGDDRLKDLLAYRYLSVLTWEQVAQRMEMDERWVRRLHIRAVDKLTLESPAVPVV